MESLLDPKGRYIIIKALIQGEPLTIINIYGPNTDQDKSTFFKQLQDVTSQYKITKNDHVIVCGDWNTILSGDLDKSGSTTIVGETVTLSMKSFLSDLGLVDIWRVKNPTTRRFTYRQRRPLIQSRLDFYTISNCVIARTNATVLFPLICPFKFLFKTIWACTWVFHSYS